MVAIDTRQVAMVVEGPETRIAVIHLAISSAQVALGPPVASSRAGVPLPTALERSPDH